MIDNSAYETMTNAGSETGNEKKQLIVLLKGDREVRIDADSFEMGHHGDTLGPIWCLKGDLTVALFSPQEVIGVIRAEYTFPSG